MEICKLLFIAISNLQYENVAISAFSTETISWLIVCQLKEDKL